MFICRGIPEECLECQWSDCKRPSNMAEGIPYTGIQKPRKKMSEDELKRRMQEKNRDYYLRHMELKRKMARERYHKKKGETK